MSYKWTPMQRVIGTLNPTPKHIARHESALEELRQDIFKARDAVAAPVGSAEAGKWLIDLQRKLDALDFAIQLCRVEQST